MLPLSQAPACRVLVVHALAPVDAEHELLLATVVALERRDQVLLEPQPREGGSNSSSIFDFRVLKRVQRQFPSAETAQNRTILEDPGTSSHPNSNEASGRRGRGRFAVLESHPSAKWKKR